MFEKLITVNNEKNICKLLISILIAEAVGLLSGFLGRSNVNTYMELNKPSFAPPGWLFPIVWIILYLLMAIAAYRIWMKGEQGEDVNEALKFYSLQLVFNFFWSIIFFRFELYGVAFFELLILLLLVIYTTYLFYKIDPLAAYLMIPYLLWLSYAGILNYSIWKLN
jgi:tryptophan-rich sensory protein